MDGDKEQSGAGLFDSTKQYLHDLVGKGFLYNHSNHPITVWAGQNRVYGPVSDRFYIVQPGQSAPLLRDIDHVKDVHGQWWKIGGPNVAFVDKDGNVVNALCETDGPKLPCAEVRQEPSPDGKVDDDVEEAIDFEDGEAELEVDGDFVTESLGLF